MKKKFLLDTDILADFFHKQRYTQELLPNLIEKGLVHISILTISELRAGFTQEQARVFLPKLYKTVGVLTLTKNVAELGGELRFEYRLKGISLSVVDTLIAATAITQNCQLVTRNKKDYPMPQLSLYQFEN